MARERIAILDTTTARRQLGSLTATFGASPRLLELLADGYTVYIASTRHRMWPDEYDKCLYDLIPAERIFHAREELATCGSANDASYIDLWTRLLNRFNIPIPTTYDGEIFIDDITWMDLRDAAQRAGIVIR